MEQMSSHMVRSFSNASRVPSHHQPGSPPQHQQEMMSPQLNHSVEYRQPRLVLSPHQPHLRAASTYESSQLIANESQLDPALLAHENPNNCSDLASPLPLEQYKLNIDRSPLVVRRKPQEKVHYTQKVAVRYLQPPPPPKCGDILVQELPSKQIAPAPALVVRQAPPKPATPPPLIIRFLILFFFV